MEQDKKYKVSIVTAVYNVEAYLGEMVESIVRQTIGFDNIQLILVDDGSEDLSGVLCDQYAERYPDNIVAVHKENGGVSSARNEGLKHVRGEYLNFTDADDMLEKNALRLMYGFLKENEAFIDLCAIPLQFFGARCGEHQLNYKFEKGSRVIDLQQEYDCIQLSMSSVLVKRDCFCGRAFDEGLAYAEDAKVVVDILLDKMRLGVVYGTYYWYRKRESADSAIDLSGMRADYYIPYMKRFILYSMENARKRKGYLPLFVQYTCMYDLQWRFKRHPFVNPGVLTEDEEKEYRDLWVEALREIDDQIIIEQRHMDGTYKMAVLLLKEEKRCRKEIIAGADRLEIRIRDVLTIDAGDYPMAYEFLEILQEEIIIEGYVKYFAGLEDIGVVLKGEQDGVVWAEYQAELLPREDRAVFCMDDVITQAKGFKIHIARGDLPRNLELTLYLRYQGQDILCRNITFGKFFPLAKQLENSYLYYEGFFLTYSENRLILSGNVAERTARRQEWLLQRELLSKKDGMIIRACVARNIYHLLKRVKRKEIWLIGDRLTKADDNGEAFFTYMNTIGKNPGIDTYFVLDKDSKDRGRLLQIGKVVSYHSTKYKILSLLCDKIISSHGDDYVFNRFFNMAYLYKDIKYRQKTVFLQHGVIKDDLSGWLARPNKNLNLFITTTCREYQSVLEGTYYYNEDQVKCTGLPRYDYLYNNVGLDNVITFMPTWRQYLASGFMHDTDSRILNQGFESSAYCAMYRQVFEDSRLYDAAERYHYTIRLMMHPTMPRECLEYFRCGDMVQILEKSTRYKEIYAESKLVITDYSSAVFDFAYLRKPVIYYQQDKDEFFSGKHVYKKGYFDYERDGFGEVEYTAEALVDRIIEYMQNGCQLKEIYRDRIERTFPHNDRNNCGRVYEEITKL